jgi:hypothetical protein
VQNGTDHGVQRLRPKGRKPINRLELHDDHLIHGLPYLEDVVTIVDAGALKRASSPLLQDLVRYADRVVLANANEDFLQAMDCLGLSNVIRLEQGPEDTTTRFFRRQAIAKTARGDKSVA